MKNKWYIATLIIQAKVGKNTSGSWMCDEQIHLLRAPDEETAYTKAIELGKNKEHSYQNEADETVSWEFIGLADLEELDATIRDGVEIRSRLFDSPDPAKLVSDKPRLMVYLTQKSKPETPKIEELAPIS